jgi:hypothetical protein
LRLKKSHNCADLKLEIIFSHICHLVRCWWTTATLERLLIYLTYQYIWHRDVALRRNTLFQKEIYTFQSLYTFVQRTCTVFRTVTMW